MPEPIHVPTAEEVHAACNARIAELEGELRISRAASNAYADIAIRHKGRIAELEAWRDESYEAVYADWLEANAMVARIAELETALRRHHVTHAEAVACTPECEGEQDG